MEFKKELTDLINKFSLDNKCNTPDYILCDYILNCIENYYNTTRKKDEYSKIKDTQLQNKENNNLFGVPLQKIEENQPQKPSPIPAEMGQKITTGWSNPFGGTSWGV
jgi:hypothetical protein